MLDQEEINKQLAAIWLAGRKRKGLSQAAAAGAVGCSEKEIADYENGRKGMKMPRFFKLCDVYNLKPASVVNKIVAGN